MKVYMDNNRVTLPDPQVISVMQSVYKQMAGDISAPHFAGSQSRKIYVETIERIRLCTGASEKDLDIE
jgi:cysteine sulfinate desulfinase/cysteine desulfurase-like protein